MSARYPRRAFRLQIDLHADTSEDALNTLTRILGELERGEVTWDGAERRWTSGGVTDGFDVVLCHDPEMTHEQYLTDLRAWLEEDRAKRRADREAKSAATPEALARAAVEDEAGF